MRLHPEARIDLLDGVEWYEARSPGLGGDLVDEVEAAIERVAERPDSGALADAQSNRGEVRQKRVRRFPYSVVYIVASNELEVVAIRHHKRHPDYWKERSP